MSFVPEKITESPRMTPEKYGMYGNLIADFDIHFLKFGED